MGPLLWQTVQYLSSSTLVNALTLVVGAVSLVLTFVLVVVIIRVVRRLPPNSQFSMRLGPGGVRVEFWRGLAASDVTETRADGGGDEAPEPADQPVPDTWQKYVEQEIEALTATATKLAAICDLERHQIEELVQEAVTALAGKWQKAVEVGPRWYAFGVMRHKASHLSRGHSRKDRTNIHAVPLPDEATSWLGTTPGAEETFFANYDETRVLAMVKRLPERQCQVIVLVVLEEYPIPEAADLLEISAGAVRTALWLGKAKLRQLLDGDDDGEGGN